jgi:MFS family permease
VFAAGLLLLGYQSTLTGIALSWCLATVGFCTISAALTATISDQVPVEQRGLVSGWLSAPQAIGTILGLLLVTTVFVGTTAGYAAIAGLLVVLVVPFLLVAPDPELTRSQRPRHTLRALVAGLWISPLRHPDFGWTLLGRILVNLGNALGTTLLLYFLMFALQRTDAQSDLIVLTLVYMVFVILASTGLGALSDRLGRRKAFVAVAALLQAAAALLLALVPDFGAALIGAGLLGLGYGSFLSVDQALATQVLPDAANRGKDLGIMNIATAVPQALAPLLGAWIVAALVGFTGLFVLSAAISILGGLAVLPIRTVR